jgi:AcrR family transcriptional regulator
MAGDAETTRRKLLDAASAEFAAYGIAGARVDRIAEAAGCNKALIYHHFTNKDGLFDAVFNEICESTVRETPLDATDLPGYAGKLFDRYEARPEVARLATWYRLERGGDSAPLQLVLDSTRNKIAKITEAQRNGELPSHFSPVDLLGLVTHVAVLWAANTPEYQSLAAKQSRAHRRRVVTDAVAALLAK